MTKHSKLTPKGKTQRVSAKAPKRPSPGARKGNRSSQPSARWTIGLDVGDRFSTFCVLDATGVVISEGKLRTTKAGAGRYFEDLAPARVALEAGTHSGWMPSYRGMRARGDHCQPSRSAENLPE